MVGNIEQVQWLNASNCNWVLHHTLVDKTKPVQKQGVLRPTLALAGYQKELDGSGVVLFDGDDIAFLNSLPKDIAEQRLENCIRKTTAIVVVADGASAKNLVSRCLATRTPLVESKESSQKIWLSLIESLEQLAAPTIDIHATLVDVFGLGVLLTGKSGVGKSETALGLIERRHRLVCDDVVRLRVQDQSLIGMTAGLVRHHMEVRCIGIINVAHLYGVISVIDQKKIDLAVELEPWHDANDYDRLGLEWSYKQWLDIKVPYHCLPVKPGRDLVLLIETLALNHRLQAMGYHAAKELSARLEEEISRREKCRNS